jgi:peptidoglycan/xylan/chitin deacetylase (PgdA/CDA1 family)
VHIVTLSFDDGFRKSTVKTAGVFEKFNLPACFNFIAGADTADFNPVEYLDGDLGDFGLWRELAARGHEVMPHGWVHENLKKMVVEEAKTTVLKCLDRFEKELPDFRRETAVFNFPYNASSSELEAWLPTVVRAYRTIGDPINPLPSADTVRLTCTSFGPENAEDDVDRCVAELLKRPSGWLIYNTHGLDGEGWGPISSGYLERLLARLLNIETVRILPAGRALARPARGACTSKRGLT